jgi:hypothetical protein
MAALNICTWLWGNKYSVDYVLLLYRGLQRHLSSPFRFLLMTERERKISFLPAGIERHAIKDPELIGPGCLARLRMFDPGWQGNRQLTGRIVCIDLDVIITGDCSQLFERDEPLVVLQGANISNPCPYNCSVFLFQAGAHPELWTEFSIENVSKIPFYKLADDQSWMAHKVPGAAGWKAGRASGIYAFNKTEWPPGNQLPADARIVAFPGRRDPSMYRYIDWVRKHWS